MKPLFDMLARIPRPLLIGAAVLVALVVIAALLPGDAGEPARGMLSTVWDTLFGAEQGE